jgi:hypothetical protein
VRFISGSEDVSANAGFFGDQLVAAQTRLSMRRESMDPGNNIGNHSVYPTSMPQMSTDEIRKRSLQYVEGKNMVTSFSA